MGPTWVWFGPESLYQRRAGNDDFGHAVTKRVQNGSLRKSPENTVLKIYNFLSVVCRVLQAFLPVVKHNWWQFAGLMLVLPVLLSAIKVNFAGVFLIMFPETYKISIWRTLALYNRQWPAACLNTKNRSDNAVKPEAFVKMCREAGLTADVWSV